MGSLEAARLRGRLRAARHSLWDEIERADGEHVTRVAQRALPCSICGHPVSVGQRVTSWMYDDDNAPRRQHAHPDCLAVMDDLGRDEWWTGDTLSEAIGDMTWPEVVELVRGCADPDCAAVFRQIGQWAREDDGVDDG